MDDMWKAVLLVFVIRDIDIRVSNTRYLFLIMDRCLGS